MVGVVRPSSFHSSNKVLAQGSFARFLNFESNNKSLHPKNRFRAMLNG